jgi:hypothetical protein
MVASSGERDRRPCALGARVGALFECGAARADQRNLGGCEVPVQHDEEHDQERLQS